jgi:hypothetical protein
MRVHVSLSWPQVHVLGACWSPKKRFQRCDQPQIVRLAVTSVGSVLQSRWRDAVPLFSFDHGLLRPFSDMSSQTGVRETADTPEPAANNQQVIGRSIAEPSVLSLSRGPGVLRTTLLMARVTFREAARRKILWIATLAGIAFLTLFWIALHFVLKNRTPQTSTVEFREGISRLSRSSAKR